MWSRIAVGALAGAGVLLIPTAPAGAVLTSNTIGCDGRADITAADGGAVTHIEAKDSEAKVPREGTVAWQGALATPTHDHRGEVVLELGPSWDVELGSWGPSANAENLSEKQGVTQVPSALQEVPAGRYKVRGYHEGNEGGCTGHLTVEVEGMALANAAGPAGTLLFAGLLALAARRRE